jgi:hypothetical protein
MKSPPVQYADYDARVATEQFIATNGKKQPVTSRLKVAAKRPATKKVAKKTTKK